MRLIKYSYRIKSASQCALNNTKNRIKYYFEDKFTINKTGLDTFPKNKKIILFSSFFLDLEKNKKFSTYKIFTVYRGLLGRY